jgi:hypothetical protein
MYVLLSFRLGLFLVEPYGAVPYEWAMDGRDETRAPFN